MNRHFNRKLVIKIVTDWGKIFILLLDEAVVITAIILTLHFLGINIPIAIIMGIGVIAGILIFIIHVAVIPSFHRKKVTGREGMIGERGRVIAALLPKGTIFVNGEYWNAKAIGDNIEIDEIVEIIGVEDLVLKVKRNNE
ncbi:MAG: hypothetical protein JSV32_05850 [Dehalococcoidia bacterium]|nr:MAG: hypothetical protein JSV32_05850 [Dehalococcoidia bacterium]